MGYYEGDMSFRRLHNFVGKNMNIFEIILFISTIKRKIPKGTTKSSITTSSFFLGRIGKLAQLGLFCNQIW